MDQSQLNKIKEIVEGFFLRMTIPVSSIHVDSKNNLENSESVDIDLKIDDPQIVIGQQGQTLFEIQRILRMILNKQLQKIFYLNLDINNYKAQKIDYLKEIAKTSADHVALTKLEKSLAPMFAYERRIVHAELSKRTDIITESQGEGLGRHIVIKPK